MPRQVSSGASSQAGEVSAVLEATVSDRVRRLVAQATKLPGEALDDDVPLIDQGLIDSMALVQLLSAVEETFSFAIPPDDLSPEHFGSVRRLISYVQSRA
jgi:acyl carrier protein